MDRSAVSLQLRVRKTGCCCGIGPVGFLKDSRPNGVTSRSPNSTRVCLSRRFRLCAGVGATLARDVPFSALYWQLLEPIRAAMLPSQQQAGSQGAASGSSASVQTASGQPASRRQIVVANLVAGSTAGAVAAAVTTPLDVVKTRAQLAAGGSASEGGGGGGGGAASSIRASLRAIHADSGLRGLFAGVGPRAARAAPACAIVVASYEVRRAERRCRLCCLLIWCMGPLQCSVHTSVSLTHSPHDCRPSSRCTRRPSSRASSEQAAGQRVCSFISQTWGVVVLPSTGQGSVGMIRSSKALPGGSLCYHILHQGTATSVTY